MKLNSITFNNRYIQLGKDFSVETRPEPVKAPELISFNYNLAEALGLAIPVSMQIATLKMQRLSLPVVPRNHQIEAAIRAAEDLADFSIFYELHEVLQKPYEPQKEKERYMLPPEPDEIVMQTFCGT